MRYHRTTLDDSEGELLCFAVFSVDFIPNRFSPYAADFGPLNITPVLRLGLEVKDDGRIVAFLDILIQLALGKVYHALSGLDCRFLHRGIIGYIPEDSAIADA